MAHSASQISPVVSAAWLVENFTDPRIIVADCRFALSDPSLGRQQYQTSHIPGAYYFDLNQDLSGPVRRHGGRHPLPDPAAFVQTLEAAGIHSGNGQPPSLVVAYDDSRFAFASRLWWLLKYFGHDHVAVLDGGFQHWQASGYPVTPDRPAPKVGHFTPQIHPDRVVDIERVKSLTHSMQTGATDTVLIDSREAIRYRGEHEPIDPIAGHIPGAVNYPWQEATDAQGFALSKAEQEQRWRDLSEASDVWVYCGSGVTACVNLLSLELAGISHAKLYAGSWSDWCSYLVDNEARASAESPEEMTQE